MRWTWTRTAQGSAGLAIGSAAIIAAGGSHPDEPAAALQNDYFLIAYNDLGMHCMNEGFSEIAILPPFNTLRAQVFKRGDGEPDIVEENVELFYSIPANTHSAAKTDFWTHAPQLFGVELAPDVGLFGKGMSGTMEYEPATGLYEAIGIPITPIDDQGRTDPYPIARIELFGSDGEYAVTHTVIPVSQELNCHLCHAGEGVSVAMDILLDHDRLHGTDLINQTPVLCASCHADPALGAPGQPGLPTFSAAIHTAHAPRMGMVDLDNKCYACHPGQRTQCQRDVHFANGVNCTDCHGGMLAVGDPARTPWVDQPRCGDCHSRPGFEFEPPGVLFKDARGHGGVKCFVCHGSPHAIGPAVTAVDNIQAIALQGHPGPLDTCTVCHGSMPKDPFPHRFDP